MASLLGATFQLGARFGTGPDVANSKRIASAGSWEAKRPHIPLRWQSWAGRGIAALSAPMTAERRSSGHSRLGLAQLGRRWNEQRHHSRIVPEPGGTTAEA